MRYEAKHAYFKSLPHSMGNFINLPYTLAMRHQHYLCYGHATSDAERCQLNVGPGKSRHVVVCCAAQEYGVCANGSEYINRNN